MRISNILFTIIMLFALFHSCSSDTKNKNDDKRYYIDESGDTIARKIESDIIVTKYKYTSKDKDLLDKIVQHIEPFYSTKFYTQEIYDYLCEISKLEYEKYSYKSEFDFWELYDNYLLNFCYCVYDDLSLKEKDFHFVEEESKYLFYIDDVRVRNCQKTLNSHYSNNVVFWTDKELNEKQIERVINSDRPFSITYEAEFVLLDKNGTPNGKYASVLFYPNGDHYNFTHFYYKDKEYKYSFDPSKIKDHYVSIGMTINECRRAWGDSPRKEYNKINGTEYWFYSKGKYLIFEKGKLVNFSDAEDNIEE